MEDSMKLTEYIAHLQDLLVKYGDVPVLKDSPPRVSAEINGAQHDEGVLQAMKRLMEDGFCPANVAWLELGIEERKKWGTIEKYAEHQKKMYNSAHEFAKQWEVAPKAITL